MQDYKVKLYHWQLSVPNLKEYHTLRREIFSQNQYYLELSNPHPLIIDAGAHLGLTTFYFKRLFPDATIISLEPHPQAFKFLQHNLQSNHLSAVLPLNLALWPVKQSLSLYTDPSADNWWSNTRITPDSHTAASHSISFSAETTTLKELYDGVGKRIDVLKLDVEGSEWDILFDSLAHFTFIDHYVIEYHPHPGRTLLDFYAHFPNSHRVTCYKNGRPINPKTRHPGLVIVKADRA